MSSCTKLVCLLLPFLVTIQLQVTTAKKDKGLYCGACLSMVEEVNIKIGQVDPKKKIQVGSFRVDSNGNQDLKEKPYARSEVHLTEVLEDVCQSMNSYAESATADGDKTYIRTQSYDGSAISLSSVTINSETTKNLKYACESIIEEHEEEMMPVFMNNVKESEKAICVNISGICTEKMVQARMWTMASAVMKGMEERQKPTEEEDTEQEDQNDEGEDEETENENEDENENENEDEIKEEL